MAEYIERDAVINLLYYNADEVCSSVVVDFEGIPAADVAPVRHGRWIINTDDFTPAYRCSACGYNKPMIAGEKVSQGAMNYCPNCGAKVQEVSDG